MRRYDELVLEAYKKIEVLLQKYKYNRNSNGMLGILIGIGHFGVHARPDVDHNYQAVIDAIHLKFKNSKDVDVIEFYERGINLLLESINRKFLSVFCNVISYEMDLEANNGASFNVDIQKYLNVLADEIFVRHDELIESDANVDEWLKDEAKYYKENYGYELKLLDEYPKGVRQEIFHKMNLRLSIKLSTSIDKYKNSNSVKEIVDLLVGSGDSKISESERKPHCYYMVIEEIHKLYDEQKDEDILKMYENGVIAILDNVSLDSLRHFYNVIGTESEYEKENSFSFKLNGKKILKVFEEAISSKLLGIINSNPYWRDVAKNIRLLLSQM